VVNNCSNPLHSVPHRPRTKIKSSFSDLSITPRRGLGQNFLTDPQLARAIVNNLDLAPGRHVVEIGPGMGALTRWLAESPVDLTLLELDPTLATDLRHRYRDRPRTQVIEVDAARFDYGTLVPGGPFQIIGNLPYSASTAIIAAWLDPALPITRAVAMVQKEVGERLLAPHDCADYGALSVRVQRRFAVALDRMVPPTVFRPVPKVESSVLRFTPRPIENRIPCRTRTLEKLLRTGFAQRRKQLGKRLATLGVDWSAAAAHLGQSTTARAEDLTVAQWLRFARWVDQQPDALLSTGEECFDVVDTEDQVTGTASRDEVHARGLRHRAVHILLTNTRGELLLQLRSPWKDRHPSTWDSSAAGHVGSGETYAACAEREVREELGVTMPLTEIAAIPAAPDTGMEFIRLYHGNHNGPFPFDPDEMDAVRFFSPAIIQSWIERRPHDFAPGFIRCFRAAAALWQELPAPTPHSPETHPRISPVD